MEYSWVHQSGRGGMMTACCIYSVCQGWMGTVRLGIIILKKKKRQLASGIAKAVSPGAGRWFVNEAVGGVLEGCALRKASPGPEEKDLAQMQAAMLTLSGPCGSSTALPPSYFPRPQVAFAWHHPQTMPPHTHVNLSCHNRRLPFHHRPPPPPNPIKLYCATNPYASPAVSAAAAAALPRLPPISSLHLLF